MVSLFTTTGQISYFISFLLHDEWWTTNYARLLEIFKGDKLVRATELVKLLSLEKSVKGAIKLVTALKLPNLAERFNDILEVKLYES